MITNRSRLIERFVTITLIILTAFSGLRVPICINGWVIEIRSFKHLTPSILTEYSCRFSIITHNKNIHKCNRQRIFEILNRYRLEAQKHRDHKYSYSEMRIKSNLKWNSYKTDTTQCHSPING